MGRRQPNKSYKNLCVFSCVLLRPTMDRNLQASQGQSIDREMVDLSPTTFGRVKAPAGTWASCIRVIDPVQVCFLGFNVVERDF